MVVSKSDHFFSRYRMSTTEMGRNNPFTTIQMSSTFPCIDMTMETFSPAPALRTNVAATLVSASPSTSPGRVICVRRWGTRSMSPLSDTSSCQSHALTTHKSFSFQPDLTLQMVTLRPLAATNYHLNVSLITPFY